MISYCCEVRGLDWAEERCSRCCDAIKGAKVHAATMWCLYKRRQALLVQPGIGGAFVFLARDGLRGISQNRYISTLSQAFNSLTAWRPNHRYHSLAPYLGWPQEGLTGLIRPSPVAVPDGPSFT